MKNVDVPLWDKGDNTDNFVKGGASQRSMSFDGVVEADKNITSAFKLVLGRKPSTRESAYYRISRAQKNDIILKLISGAEHKELIRNAYKYPEVVKENVQLKGNILKLKSEYESRVKEYEDLKILLEEKNNTIKELRVTNGNPFVTDRRIIEESTTYNNRYVKAGSSKRYEPVKKSLWDKIIDILFG